MNVTVIYGNERKQVEVKLNSTDGKLTPALARGAAKIVIGYGWPATVTDGEVTYRVTRTGARKINS